MINTRSIRFRLTVWYALILSAALCVFSGLIYLMMEQRLLHDIRRGLDEEAGRVEAFVKREAEVPQVNLEDEIEEFCHALPASSYLELRPASGGKVFRYPVSRQTPHGHYEVLKRAMTIRGQAYTLEIGSSRVEMHRALELLGTLLMSLVPVVIAVSCLGGLWLSRRALKPVDEITSAARAIGIENLACRLPAPGTGDELERLAEAWNATLARLESAVAVLSRFAADASHELRTPVAVIRTGAELALRRDREPEAYRDSLREIAAESERMTQLVEDLLFLARRDTRAGMPMAPIDLREVLSDAAQELHGLAEAREMRIRVAVGPEDSMIAGNAAALRRLFLALLDNALKYSAMGTDVFARIFYQDGPKGDRIVVAVEDQGIGIADEELPHIFQRFYRANKARSDGGHGLGLSLAQSIAVAHDAVIEVTSEPGRGSVFQVRFERRAVMEFSAAATTR